MAKKKTDETQETPQQNTGKKMLKLLIGVNYKTVSDGEEKRVEAGLVEEGILPPAFENLLREKKKLVDA